MINPKILITGLFTLASLSISAQNFDCSQGRFSDTLFSDITVETVQFGQNTTASGQEQSLYADVYTPAQDEATDRPLIILAFGGSFISGQRGDMAPLAERYAKKGHVVASIDYRLYPVFVLGFPDDQAVAETILRAVHDMRAAVRYFKASVDQGNPFGIDPDHIYLGGISAGSITAIQATYLDDRDSLNVLMETFLDEHGGQEGDSSLDSTNLRFDSRVQGVINLSGAILDTNFIQAGDPPIFSMQGTDDDVVPFWTGNAAGLLPVYGSGIIHRVADRLGIRNLLVAVEGGTHTDIYFEPQYAAKLAEYMAALDDFFVTTLCGVTSATETIAHSDSPLVFPNPFQDHFMVAGDRVNQAVLIDVQGHQYPLSGQENHFQVGSAIPPGIYCLQLLIGHEWKVQKVLCIP